MKRVVVGVIERKNKKGQTEYLLVSSVKKSFGKYSGYYYPPGGHLEKGEDEKLALAREIKEELNLKVNPIKEIATTKGDIKDQITHWWECTILSGKLEIQEDKISDARFFTKNEMSKINLWPATKDFFNKYIFS